MLLRGIFILSGVSVPALAADVLAFDRSHSIVLIIMAIVQAALLVALLRQNANRRRTEAALSESEYNLSLVAEASGLGIWTYDVARGTLWASAQLRRFMGLSEVDPYDFERFLSRVHPDDRSEIKRCLAAILKDGKDCDFDFRVLRPTGELRWAAMRGGAKLDGQGRPTHLHGVTFDITGQKEAAFALQRHHHELSRLSRIEMLGQLSGSLAHELNQPLTAILSNAQAALRFLKSDAADLDEVREILKDIVSDDQRAGEVIRRLRGLFERGEMKRETIQVNEVIEEVLTILRSDLVSRNVTAEARLASDLPTVVGDRVQLQQLILNLVVNACEAMADNAPGERRLAIGAWCNESGDVVVAIKDRGKGIAPEQIEKIFEPFFTTKDHGTGLGLAISRSIVASHGGYIWATPNVGGGAIFSFSLPAQRTTESVGEERMHG
jgi:PAS domain S-box-containing protein